MVIVLLKRKKVIRRNNCDEKKAMNLKICSVKKIYCSQCRFGQIGHFNIFREVQTFAQVAKGHTTAVQYR
jgi:hypothetical protein